MMDMAYRRGAEAYRHVEARSRSPLELVVMLYDGALRFLVTALEADAAGQRPDRAAAVSRVLAIVGELQSTLDLDKGGELARELDRLYAYIQARLLDVTMNEDREALTEVQRLLSTLRSSWAAIATQPPASVAR